jgi:hypothetical protein
MTTVGEVQVVTTKDPRTLQKHSFFSEPLMKLGFLLMARFFSTLEMARSTTISQVPRRRSPDLFTIFHEEVTTAPTAKPTMRSSYKINKFIVSHSNKL